MRLFVPVLLSACAAIPVGERATLPSGDVPVDHGVVTDSALAEEMDELMLSIIETGGVNVGVALVKGDEVVFTGAYGWADLGTETPLTTDTPMAMASVSKTFIGVAAMQGVEAGRLSLDDSLSDLVGFPVDNPKVEGESITLRHVLTHNSGLEDSTQYPRSYDVGDPVVGLKTFTRSYVTPGDVFYRSGNFANRPPNDDFSYSNVGAGLAALAVGEAAELEFAELVERDILQPLGMTHSGYFLPDLPVAPATQYNSKMRPYEQYGYPTYPDGMMRSSANDMAKYLAMMQGNGIYNGVRVLSEASVEEMLTVDPSLGTDEDGQAIVWARLGYLQGRPLMGHTGGDFGTAAILGLDRETGSGMVILINSESTDFDVAFSTLQPMLELVDELAL